MPEPDARYRPIDEVIRQRLLERDELARLERVALEVDRSARIRSPPPHHPHPLLPRVKIVTSPNGETVTTIY